MARCLQLSHGIWVVLAASIASAATVLEEQDSSGSQEQVKDQDYGTDVKISTSPNIIHWIFIPGLGALVCFIGCSLALCAYRRFQAPTKPTKRHSKQALAASQQPVREVSYRSTRSTENEAARNSTTLANGKDSLKFVSAGMGAVFMCGDCSLSCKEAVEQLYSGCSEPSEGKEIQEVRNADGQVLPFVVQVPEAHLTILEARYKSQITQQSSRLAFVRTSVFKQPAPRTSSSVPVKAPVSPEQIEFAEDNDEESENTRS
jgi:hypothetical protein